MYNKNSSVLNNTTRTEQITVSKLKRKATDDKKHPPVLDSILRFESHKSFHDFTVPETDIVCNFLAMLFTSFSLKVNFPRLASN